MNDLTALDKKLNQNELEHLDGLIRSWDLLADLSFADLLLCVAEPNIPVYPYTVVAHVRPTTSRSIYRTKMEGTVFKSGERPFLDQARKTLESIDGGLLSQTNVERIRTLCIPVSYTHLTLPTILLV